MCGFALVLAADLGSCDPPEVVTRILAGAVDQQIFFLVNKIPAVELSYFEIGRQLDGVSGAGLFAITTEDAP